MHGALDYSLLFSRTGAYRFYFNDKLTFNKSFYHTIEHGPEGNQYPVVYTSVAFYYSDTNAGNAESPKNSNTQVYIPDTLNIYPEFTKMAAGDNMEIKTSWDSASIGQSFRIKTNNESSLIYILMGYRPVIISFTLI